jgi:hypothetical protein
LHGHELVQRSVEVLSLLHVHARKLLLHAPADRVVPASRIMHNITC